MNEVSEEKRLAQRSACKKWRDKNKSRVKEYNKQYKQVHHQEIRAYDREYKASNIENNRKYSREYGRIQRKLRPVQGVRKLANKRRTRRGIILKQHRIIGSTTMNELGCTLPEWKKWLEDHFYQDMVWENHGKVWHLDEMIPVCAWNLNDPEQWAACWHWTNSQPLTVKENLTKSKKPEDFQAAIQERLMVLRAGTPW